MNREGASWTFDVPHHVRRWFHEHPDRDRYQELYYPYAEEPPAGLSATPSADLGLPAVRRRFYKRHEVSLPASWPTWHSTMVSLFEAHPPLPDSEQCQDLASRIIECAELAKRLGAGKISQALQVAADRALDKGL